MNEVKCERSEEQKVADQFLRTVPTHDKVRQADQEYSDQKMKVSFECAKEVREVLLKEQLLNRTVFCQGKSYGAEELRHHSSFVGNESKKCCEKNGLGSEDKCGAESSFDGETEEEVANQTHAQLNQNSQDECSCARPSILEQGEDSSCEKEGY